MRWRRRGGRGDGVGWGGCSGKRTPPALVRPRCRRGPSVRSRVCGGGLIGNSLSADGRRRGKFFCCFFSCEPSKQNTAMEMWMCAPRAMANWTGDRIRSENKQKCTVCGCFEGMKESGKSAASHLSGRKLGRGDGGKMRRFG